MNRLFLYIVAITILILYSDQLCQSISVKPAKPIPSEEVKIFRKGPKRTSHIEVIKPINRDEIIRRKPKRKIKHLNPPQRPQKQTNPSPQKHTHPSSTIRSHTRREIADDPPKISICGYGSIRYDYIYYDIKPIDKIENDLLYEEEQKDYSIDTKLFAGKEFTDEDFPICIKEIEFEYLRNQWINSNDFPEYINDNESSEYLIYSINLNAYVI